MQPKQNCVETRKVSVESAALRVRFRLGSVAGLFEGLVSDSKSNKNTTI